LRFGSHIYSLFYFVIYCSLGNSDTQAPGLSELAQFVLREICSQEWVLERCLQNPEELCHQDMLLDSMLSSKQVWKTFFFENKLI